MANRTDAILVLASSSFLALGIATWYEIANDRPFDFASIFGKKDVNTASKEHFLNTFQSNSRAGEAELPALSDKVPANQTALDSMTTPVEIATTNPIIAGTKTESPELTQVAPMVAVHESTEGDVAAVESITARAVNQQTRATQTRVSARTVTIVLSPRPAAQSVAEADNVEDPLPDVLSTKEVKSKAEALDSESEDSDAAGQLQTNDAQQLRTATLVTGDISEIVPGSDDNSQTDNVNQTALTESQAIDDEPLLGAVKEVGKTIAATTYRVEAGDSLYRIALTHGTSVNALKQLNALGSDKLYVGDELQLR